MVDQVGRAGTLSGGDGGREPGATGEKPRGGIDVFDALFVRQPIREGAVDDVRTVVADWARDNRNGDARTLVPVDGVNLVTLFLDDDALLWYVEVLDDDAPAWEAPDRRLRVASPLFDAGLDALLAPTGTVHADGVGRQRTITHATHPDRAAWYAAACPRPLVAPVAGDDLPIEVATTTFAVKEGLVGRAVDASVRLGNWIKGVDTVDRWLRGRTDVLEAERMYTETLLWDRAASRIRYYMETESTDRLYDAYEDSGAIEVRFSDWAMRRIFERPERVVERPMDADAEALIHAVDPDRP